MQSSQEIIQNKKLIANSYKLEAKRLKANSYYKLEADKSISLEDKATMLIETLKADKKWHRWYCGVIKSLPENVIQNILEGARKADYPDCYFARSAKVEMSKLSGQ